MAISIDRINGARSSLAIKAPVLVATTADITLSGVQTINGVDVVAGDRVLVRSQTIGADNGIYDVKSGTWVRSVDYDGQSDITKGTSVRVTGGDVGGNAVYVLQTDNPVIGTTATVWQQITASIEVGVVADMISDAGLVIGDTVETLGRSIAGDGGAAIYNIVAAGTGTDDGGSYIDLTASGLQAQLITGNNVKLEQFGVVLDASGNPQERSAQAQNAIYYAFDMSRAKGADTDQSITLTCYTDYLVKDVLYFTKTPEDPTEPWEGKPGEVDIYHPGRITATTGGELETHLNSEATRLGVTLGTLAAAVALKDGSERPMPIVNMRNKRSRVYFGSFRHEFLCSGVRLDSCSSTKMIIGSSFSVRKYSVMKANKANGGYVLEDSTLKQWGISDTSDYSGRMLPGGTNTPENYTADTIVSAYKDNMVIGGTYGWSRAAIVLLDQTRDIASLDSVAASIDLAAIASPSDGDERIALDTDHLWRYVSGAWVDKGDFYSVAELGMRTYPDALARASSSRFWGGATNAPTRGVDYVMTSQGTGDNMHYGAHWMQGGGGNATQPSLANIENGGPIGIECWNTTNRAYFIGCDIDGSTIQIHGDAVVFIGGSYDHGGKNKFPTWNGTSWDAGSGDRIILIDPVVRVYAQEGRSSFQASALRIDGITGSTIGFFPSETGVMAGDFSEWNYLNRQDTGVYKGAVQFHGLMTSTAAFKAEVLALGISNVRLTLPTSPPLGNYWSIIEDDDAYNIRPLTLDYDTETGNFTAGLVVTGGTSGATGTIQRLVDNGTDGTVYLTNVAGTFIDGEAITDTSTGAAAVNGAPTTKILLNGDIVYCIDAAATDVWDDTLWHASATNDGNGLGDIAIRDPGQGAEVQQPGMIVVPKNLKKPFQHWFTSAGYLEQRDQVAGGVLNRRWDGTDLSWTGAMSYNFGEELFVDGSGSGDIITGSVGGLDKISLFHNVGHAIAGLKPYDAAGSAVLSSRLSYSQTNDDWFFGGAWDQHKVVARELDFETRAEAVTWLAAGNVRRNGVVFYAAGFAYMFDSAASDITDMVGVKPALNAYVDHFGENTTPGTTDMLAAAQAMHDAGLSVVFWDGDYFFSGPLLIKNSGTKVIGTLQRGGSETRGTTIRLDPASTTSAFIFSKTNPDTTPLNHAGISNIRIEVGGNTSRTGWAIECINCAVFTLDAVRWGGAYNGLLISGGKAYSCTNFKATSPGAATTVSGSAAIRVQPHQRADLSYIVANNVTITDFEISGGSLGGIQDPIDILYADGLRIDNGYISSGGRSIIKFGPTAYANIAATMISNCYFDCVQFSPSAIYVPSTASVGFIGVSFTNCFFNMPTSKLLDISNAKLNYWNFEACHFKSLAPNSLGRFVGDANSTILNMTDCRMSDGTEFDISDCHTVNINGMHLRDITSTNALTLSGTINNLTYNGLSYKNCTGVLAVTATGWDDTPKTEWYESGTYTPVLAFGGATTGITYSRQKATWVRIGAWVTASIDITLTSKGTATGTARITLPFTAASSATTEVRHAASIAMHTISASTADGLISAFSEPSTTNLALFTTAAATGSSSSMKDTAFLDTTNLRLQVTYQV